ncbi:arginine--tRNA ligase [bacterium]|nr:MAG: arginine--tRNA ligase [bacterium]
MKEYLHKKLLASLASLGLATDAPPIFESPRQPDHGDLTTNIAMVLARKLKRNPRELAQQIIGRLDVDHTLVAKIEVAGPGFMNFFFTGKFYQQQLRELVVCGDRYGRSEQNGPMATQVEFVSANPTGPLTVGHGRGAVFGDTIARLLEWTGHRVEREYYFNNAGRQMRILGDSVRLRYLELLGDPIEFPEDYYQGEYIKDIARHLVERQGDGLRNEPATGKFKGQAEQEIFADIKKTLKLLGIEFQSFFNENSLYETGKIAEVIEELRRRDLVYEKEGALWFKTSALGAEQDKVIVKSTGEPTYRLPDIAYHREKFRRGYDLMIDVFGSDHVATYPDVLAALKALDYDTEKVKVLIHQFVTITQEGEVVKMSTRKANFITLDELIEDVGADVVRYFFLMRTITSHLNFDLALARQQSDENPVYYLQYAHARICSILRYAEQSGHASFSPDADYALLTTGAEMDLIKILLQLPEVIASCASSYEPHRLAEYLHSVAGIFHRFYHECRVVSESADLTKARLALCNATRIVIRNGLSVLGISAPEQM